MTTVQPGGKGRLSVGWGQAAPARRAVKNSLSEPRLQWAVLHTVWPDWHGVYTVQVFRQLQVAVCYAVLVYNTFHLDT